MDTIADIKARIDVAELVGEYVPLKPAGAGTFKGVCPFHQERTPSFHVSRSRQSWHCFGCDTGGDIFSFIERIEGMEFREALTFLAQKAGVTIEVSSFQQLGTSKKKRLFEVNALAARFFRSVLLQVPQAAEARAYVQRRGIDELTADLFSIGYALESWSALTEALTRRGVSADELVAAGLAMKRERGEGVYDRFRGRLMFPITDVHGNVVGFTGRILTSDPQQPKYMNTPETMVYKKSGVLYGLDKAKGEIRKQDIAVIVEGNMDVVSSHQAGIFPVVAASGTALTIEQLTLIKRFTTSLAIAFDQDAAGGAATLRGLDLARQEGFSIKIITLPPEAGKDPDEACKKDPALWKQAIQDAKGIVDWVYARAFSRHGGTSPESKRAIADEVLPEITRILHPVERDAWVKRLAKDLEVDQQVLSAGIKKSGTILRAGFEPKAVTARFTTQDKERTGGTTDRVEDRQAWRWFAGGFLSAADFAQTFATATIPMEIEDDPALVALYRVIHASYTQDGFLPPSSDASFSQTLSRLTATLEPSEATTCTTLMLLAEHAFSSMNRATIEHERSELSRLLRRKALDRKRSLLLQEMSRAEAAQDLVRIRELEQAFSALLHDL